MCTAAIVKGLGKSWTAKWLKRRSGRRTANRWDPDILVGYEIQKSSWGYLLERGSQLRLDLASMLSRVPKSPEEHPREAGDPEGDAVLDRDVVVPGRIVLNLWRIMRKEVRQKPLAHVS